jgi:hypothetical protein
VLLYLEALFRSGRHDALRTVCSGPYGDILRSDAKLNDLVLLWRGHE